MKYIISGTNRPRSRSLVIAKLIQHIYQNEGDAAELIDLSTIPFKDLDGSQYTEEPPTLKEILGKINASSGLIVVCPEYNGSYPGVLKYFIDHWKYPLAFEHRPVCFVGLGGRFGGLRPVEHLQSVFGYRNSFVYPERVFLMNVFQTIKEGKLLDATAENLLTEQARGFIRFVQALTTAGLSAEARLVGSPQS
jgi:NAD(P)H-dependent FMN reductase